MGRPCGAGLRRWGWILDEHFDNDPRSIWRADSILASTLWEHHNDLVCERQRLEERERKAGGAFDRARLRVQRRRAEQRHWPCFGRAAVRGRSIVGRDCIAVVTDVADGRFLGPHYPSARLLLAVPPTERLIYWEAIREDVSRCGFPFMLTSVDILRRRFRVIYDWADGPVEKAVYVFRRQP